MLTGRPRAGARDARRPAGGRPRGMVAGALAVPLLGMAAAGAARPAPAGPPGSLGSQVRAAEQPALHAVGLPSAWQLSRGQGVTVAVLDTGVNPEAADLTGSVITGPDYTLGADPPGFSPPHLHGTYIASLIAGHGSGPGRAAGVIGIAPAARILSVRVLLDDSEPGIDVYNASPRYGDAVGKGVRYAVRHGATVINMSLGSATATRGLRSAVAYAISHNVVVVAAAGNGGSGGSGFTPYSYPAAYPGVIGVAAVGASGTRAGFSDRNASVEISAPGVNVVGAGPSSYIEASGTSPASAFVAGVAVLVRSAYPHLSPALVEQALVASAGDRPAGGYSTDVGFGEVSAVGALHAAARLAARKPATGMSPWDRAVAGAPGPIQVVHRDTARIATFGGLSAAGAAGFLAALVALIVLARRAARDRRAVRPSSPAPAGPPLAAGQPPLPPYAPRYPPPGYRTGAEPPPEPPGYPGPAGPAGEPGGNPWVWSPYPGPPGYPAAQEPPSEPPAYPAAPGLSSEPPAYPAAQEPPPEPPTYRGEPGPPSEPPAYPAAPGLSSEPPAYPAAQEPPPQPSAYPAAPEPPSEPSAYPAAPGPRSDPPGYPATPPAAEPGRYPGAPEPPRDDDSEPPTEDLPPVR